MHLSESISTNTVTQCHLPEGTLRLMWIFQAKPRAFRSWHTQTYIHIPTSIGQRFCWSKNAAAELFKTAAEERVHEKVVWETSGTLLQAANCIMLTHIWNAGEEFTGSVLSLLNFVPKTYNSRRALKQQPRCTLSEGLPSTVQRA